MQPGRCTPVRPDLDQPAEIISIRQRTLVRCLTKDTVLNILIYQGSAIAANKAANLAQVQRISHSASLLGADAVVFPELFTTGYNLGAQLRSLAEPPSSSISKADWQGITAKYSCLATRKNNCLPQAPASRPLNSADTPVACRSVTTSNFRKAPAPLPNKAPNCCSTPPPT